MIEFELDMLLENPDTVLDSLGDAISGGAQIIKIVTIPSEAGYCGVGATVTFRADSEAAAFAVVDSLYGPEIDDRDSNRFYVFGD